MRPSFTMSLLLLSLLLSEQAQGIRLDKGSKLVGVVVQDKPIQVLEEIALSKTNNGATEEAIQCKDGQCSGNNRKLSSVAPSTTITTTTTTTFKNEKSGKSSSTNSTSQDIVGHDDHEEKSNFHVDSLTASVRNSEKTGFDHYPDAVDLAEMDYSPARRKTPIHN